MGSMFLSLAGYVNPRTLGSYGKTNPGYPVTGLRLLDFTEEPVATYSARPTWAYEEDGFTSLFGDYHFDQNRLSPDSCLASGTVTGPWLRHPATGYVWNIQTAETVFAMLGDARAVYLEEVKRLCEGQWDGRIRGPLRTDGTATFFLVRPQKRNTPPHWVWVRYRPTRYGGWTINAATLLASRAAPIMPHRQVIFRCNGSADLATSFPTRPES